MVLKAYHSTRYDGVRLFRTYSTDGLKIHKIGTDEIYDEAIDVETAEYSYEETEIPVDFIGEVTEADYQNALREMGVKV
jgi:hypothetical protein